MHENLRPHPEASQRGQVNQRPSRKQPKSDLSEGILTTLDRFLRAAGDGITNQLFPDELTKLGNTAPEPTSTPGRTGSRAQTTLLASFGQRRPLLGTRYSRKRSELFDKIGCATCHVRCLTTAPAGTKVNGGMFTIPDALWQEMFYPFGDFLLHDVGTGDGIAIPMAELWPKRVQDQLEKSVARRIPEEPQQGAPRPFENNWKQAP